MNPTPSPFMVEGGDLPGIVGCSPGTLAAVVRLRIRLNADLRVAPARILSSKIDGG